MNILMLAPLPPPSGGIASWTVRYRYFCESNNIPLRIVNIAMQGERATNEVMTRSFRTELHRSKAIIKSLRAEIKNKKTDIIHINTSCSPYGVLRDAACVFAIQNKVPFVLHCRCNIADQLGHKYISHKAFEYMVKKASKVIVLNKFSKKYVDDIEMGKSVYIPNFANEKMIENHHDINPVIKKIIYVGHIERAKGLAQIVEVAALLPDISFELIGAIREDISDINMPTNITIVGRVSADEVQDYLRKADVFLFPSQTEGFSNAVLEAMAVGLPIVASDVGANSDMIEDKGGIIVRENNAKHLRDAIIKMYSPDLRNNMSAWNIKKVRDSYIIDKVMAMYLELYESVVGENK